MAEEASQQRRKPVLSLVHASPPVHAANPTPLVGFDRRELQTILDVYGRKVSAGEWRDYALDFLRDRAVFSIYARASERALYTIEKVPKLRGRQGMYMVIAADGRILKRGHALETVLRILDPRLALVQ
jgi:hypothetical protein